MVLRDEEGKAPEEGPYANPVRWDALELVYSPPDLHALERGTFRYAGDKAAGQQSGCMSGWGCLGAGGPGPGNERTLFFDFIYT